MQLFNDTIVLITGASRGLGRALALAFAREGADLIINSRQDSANELCMLQSDLEALGVRCLAVSADLADRRAVERLAAQTLAAFGRVDIVINNASMLGPTPLPYLADTTYEDFMRVLQVNLLGPFLLTRALLGAMLMQEHSLIINISSDAGVNAYQGWGAYGISKAGLEHLTRIWATELDGSGVRIISVDPGSMNTLMHRLAEPDEDPSQWADPAGVAEAILALAAAQGTASGSRYDIQTLDLQEGGAA